MRWILLLAPLLFACPAPVDELVFQLPDGTTGRELSYDFGPRGGPASITAILKNTSDHELAINEPQFEGDAFNSAGLSSGTIGAGGEISIPIFFTPTDAHEGAIRISTSKGVTASLTLSGHFDSARCALPDVVDFGAVLPGERPQGTVTFPVVDTRRDAYVGPPGAPFNLPANAPAGTESVSAGETLTARAVLSAPDAGEYSATWKLDPGGECAAKDVQLRATVLTRHLAATPTTVDFGVIVPPGQPTATATILNSLSRPVPVTLELLSSAGGPTTNFRGGLMEIELPPATRDAMGSWRPGEAQVPLSAWLLGAGTVTGKLVVTADTDSIEVPLIARGAGAGLQITPSRVELEIPEVEGQRLDVSTGVTVLNGDLQMGASALTVSSITIEADPGTPAAALCVGKISSTGACQSLSAPIVLAPGAQASLALRISPPQGTGPWRWFVVLHTDDAQQPELRFEVTARSRLMSDCALTQPQALSFGAVRAPTPMVHAVVLENLGLATCVLQGIWVDGSNDVRVPASSFIVGAGEKRILNLEYLPSTAPGTSAFPTLRFSVNSGSAPIRSVPLETASDDGCLFVSPEQWDFGVSAPSCGPRVQRFGVGNRCTAMSSEVVIMGARVTGSAAFSLDGTPTQRLAPSTYEADSMRVSFDPAGAGVQAGALEVDVQVSGGVRTLRVPLRGKGDASGRQRDRYVMPSSADVLLVQDASAGAGEMQRALSLRADALLALARARNASVRIGGVNADETVSAQLREVDGLRWLSADAVSAAQLTALLDVGTAMTNQTEAFLAPGLSALSGPNITGFNAGFVRRGASLNVVSLSNAGEGSTQPMSVLLPQLRALKGTQRTDLFSWSAVGPFAPATSGCTYDEASPNTIQRTVAQQLGGVVAEHCEILASAQLFEASVAPTLFGTRAELSLKAPIETGALPNVIVAGMPIPETGANMVRNWNFDVTRRSVTFSSLTLLPGDVVEFEYPTLCAP